jgi:hypothetical protein
MRMRCLPYYTAHASSKHYGAVTAWSAASQRFDATPQRVVRLLKSAGVSAKARTKTMKPSA